MKMLAALVVTGSQFVLVFIMSLIDEIRKRAKYTPVGFHRGEVVDCRGIVSRMGSCPHEDVVLVVDEDSFRRRNKQMSCL